jgi:hypothetical protein
MGSNSLNLNQNLTERIYLDDWGKKIKKETSLARGPAGRPL